MMLRLLLLFAALGSGFVGRAQAGDHVDLLGTYTGEGSRGIYVVRLDGATGALSAPELAIELSNPEFLAAHPERPIIYALTQVTAADGRSHGAVAALAWDASTLRLTRLNAESSGLAPLTHLAVDSTGRMIVAASYNGGYVVSYPIRPDGLVGAPASVREQKGPLGPNQARQDASHPHSVTLSPDNRFAFVANLGLDRVFSYRLSLDEGRLAPGDPAFAVLTPGTGPRHTKFSPDGRTFYVLDELDSTVTACRYEAASGRIEPFQRISALPDSFAGQSTASEVRVHPNGRFVYTANRGHDSLAVFARDPGTGALTRIEIVPSGGKTPRNFALTPDGAWLLCAHQTSGNLTVFRVDSETGRLAAVPQHAEVPKAVCVLFLR